jgi:hypothetical protein
MDEEEVTKIYNAEFLKSYKEVLHNLFEKYGDINLSDILGKK